ncbi:hypothetical protein R7892_09605 [Ligilactobacillus murinus]|uniref:hypothetical protein n=1 Tax=Ligilactobacillus murinus TaxID=1622 RepID=UPI00296ADBEA|nr:hypothetical protein [Ligilactobacillus murinus]WOY88923.1 hypothetical protein R7892_09605 [Ligilactobacillus murinus]
MRSRSLLVFQLLLLFIFLATHLLLHKYDFFPEFLILLTILTNYFERDNKHPLSIVGLLLMIFATVFYFFSDVM